jgi:hypothetical protein
MCRRSDPARPTLAGAPESALQLSLCGVAGRQGRGGGRVWLAAAWWLISLSALGAQSVRGGCLGFLIPCGAVRRPESSGSLPRQDRAHRVRVACRSPWPTPTPRSSGSGCPTTWRAPRLRRVKALSGGPGSVSRGSSAKAGQAGERGRQVRTVLVVRARVPRTATCRAAWCPSRSVDASAPRQPS